LQVLLSGTVEEREDWWCESCSRYVDIIEMIHDGESAYRLNGRRESYSGGMKGMTICTCGSCGYASLQKNIDSYDSRLRLKTHEVITITEADAEGTDIMEFVNGEGKATKARNNGQADVVDITPVTVE